jgi:CTP:molybdopterin cytidylyltransferase MocA
MALSLSKPDNIIIPSYNFHRGHPWLLPRKFIHPLKNFPSSRTMKDFIHVYESEISYYIIKSSIVLSDLDTPEEYEQMKPN